MTLSPVPIRNITITSPLWTKIIQSSHERTLPSIIQTQKDLDHWWCLTWPEGHPQKPHAFWDSDIYKITEAACNFLVTHPDPKMLAEVEATVDMIRKAQHPDGYINSYFTTHGISKRWTNTRDLHELYCIGHLLEATVAYEELTGTGRLLQVAKRVIDHVTTVFGPEKHKLQGYPGHQEIEIGLLRIYELSGYQPAFDLAKYFILERGRVYPDGEIFYDKEAKARGADPYDDLGTEHKAWFHGPRDYGYQQADGPLVEATAVKGHAVRAMYYYAAATDLVRLSSEKDADALVVKTALQRLWRDLVDKKLYVTGGIGNARHNEGFEAPYLLGDLEVQGCYAETCASFGLINWCQRMLRLNLDSEFADVMERALFNGFLGAVSADGNAFYYQNVLRTLEGQPKQRNTWFAVACCPPNMAKLLGSLGPLIYSTNEDKSLVAVHLYIGSTMQVPGTDIVIHQETNMPRDGRVKLRIEGTTSLALRVPSWAKSLACSMTGEVKNGYLYLASSTDDQVEVTFGMKPEKVYANPLTGKDEICLVRGPIVYCIEDVDNEGMSVDNLVLTDEPVSDGREIEIGSIKALTLETTGRQIQPAASEGLYNSRPWVIGGETETVVAIPYFLRANRNGNGGMRVWTRRMSSFPTNGANGVNGVNGLTNGA